MHREPEWDERTRAEALGALYADQLPCPQCGNVDSVVEVPDPKGREARWVWPGQGDEPARAYTLKTYRCVACAGLKVAERAEAKRAEAAGDLPTDRYAPGDGAWTVAVPRYDH